MEVPMKRTHIASSVLAAAFVAACAQRDSVTAPSANAVVLSPAGFRGAGPSPWKVTGSSHDLPFTLGVDVGWVWLSGGVAITATSRSVVCHPDVASTLSGSDVRPAAADGFFAFVGWPTPNTKTWSFDPSGPFKVQLKGTSVQTICDMVSCTQLKSSGTLKVES